VHLFRHALERPVLALVATVALVLGLTVQTGGVAEGAAGAPPEDDAPQVAAAAPRSVTLLTGDVVTVADAGNGRRAATVTPAKGRETVTFQTLDVDGELQVIPSDAVPYLATGVVDRELFEVTTLLDDGYADRDGLPLIVSWNGTTRTAERTVAGTELTRTLPSLDGAALDADIDTLGTVWRALTPGSSAVARTPGTSAARLAGGIQHVWLDGRAEATLDRSVAQIGAPDAWAAGYLGEGVEVAVLDTGVDAQHPDLVGQVAEAKDFTASPSGTADRFGHGTHVAATIASSGAGASGTYRGVAPETDLLVGKVLGDDGFGYDSQIIAGMQWAADEGASVVNMSLGGGPTDGTDPLSLALDQISTESGALFVVAAGNSGGDAEVSTPSTASTALSVAAVDRDESLAPFSSRGPRTGDGALKPEISAPGVDIVAARAAGTTMGTPVDALYTSASGTSMATPHVAGAAALLAQQHPDWTGQQLKDALMSTAQPNPELTVYEQGAGRVDLTRATAQKVSATGAADFGQQDGDDVSPRRDVTYRNDGDQPVTLDLTLAVTDLDDADADAAAFSVPQQVTVPAHGTAEVTIALDRTRLDRGRWSGALLATGPGGIGTRTAVGAQQKGPVHTLSVRAVGFQGEPTYVSTLTLFGDKPGADFLGFMGPGQVLDIEVEEGDYVLQGLITATGTPQDERMGTIIMPDLHLTSDRSVLLDARTTKPVEIRTPQVSEQQTVLSWYTHRVFGTGRDIQHGIMAFSVSTPWVTPTKPVDDGEFEFSSRWQLVRPSALVTVPGSDVRPRTNLLHESALLDGPRTLELAAPKQAMEGVRGKIALVRSDDLGLEHDLIDAAAEAGAKAVILIRPARTSIYTVFRPEGERTRIPAIVASEVAGTQLLARAQRAGSRTVTVETSRETPYLYDVIQVSKDAVPAQIVHTVTERNSQRITTQYVDNGGTDPWANEQRFGWRPWMTYAWNDSTRLVSTPSSRVEWVSAGDSVWKHHVSHAYDSWAGVMSGGMTTPARTYKSGTSRESWFGPVVRPAAAPGAPSTRAGDVLHLQVPEFVDADGHVTVGGATSTSARLYRDGTLLTDLPDARRLVDVPTKAATYRLELDVARDDPEWQRATRTSTRWTFRSAKPSGDAAQALSLLQVGYHVSTDDAGRATRLPHPLELDVTDQAGAVTRGARLSAEASSDGGRTWSRLLVLPTGRSFIAIVPGGTKPVSLRVTAAQGTDQVVQEVIGAYDRR